MQSDPARLCSNFEEEIPSLQPSSHNGVAAGPSEITHGHLVLGIETSGFEGSVALVKGEHCLVERHLNQSGRRHAQSLVLEIGQMLKANGLAPRDVEVVAVSRGPGSFTGLRVGMVCAKTFAYSTGCRFVAIDTFAAIAANVPAEINRVTVIEDAQRDDLFVGEFNRNDAQRWVPASPIRVIARSEFLRNQTESDIVTGPGLRKLDSAEVRPHWLFGEEFCSPRASAIASLGQIRIASGSDEPASSDTDFWQASPFYIRQSAAEEKRAIAGNNKTGL